METVEKKEGFTQSITFKGMIVGLLILLMLIPGTLIEGLIWERKERSRETINKINEKWSKPQTIVGPILVIPYSTNIYESKGKTGIAHHEMYITPEVLDIETTLFPEERYYGIYKTILYRSDIKITGNFAAVKDLKINNSTIHWGEAYLTLAVGDLRGVANKVSITMNNQQIKAQTGMKQTESDLIFQITDSTMLGSTEELAFSCALNLNGSSYMDFIPMGQTTTVNLKGDWKAPSFIGSFSPTSTIDQSGFQAKWTILDFNRNIPSQWVDNESNTYNTICSNLRYQNSLWSENGSSSYSFGVNLIDTVDHYQQNTRSAKYSIMFIALTFLVFFFVEIFTKKKIHPIQYILVGLALILFYVLLLSLSEQIGFGWAYLTSSFAIITMIISYTYSVFKKKKQVGIMTAILIFLYTFLYTILQLEDIALLIGSIGLFIILGITMFVSKKVKWYKENE